MCKYISESVRDLIHLIPISGIHVSISQRVDIKCHMGKYFQIAAYSIQMLFQPVCQNHRSFSLLERLASEYRWKESVQITLVASSPDLPHGIWHSTLHFQLLSHGNSTGSQIGLLSMLHWNS